MKDLGSYLRDRVPLLLLGAAVFAVFLITCWLGGQDMSVAGYGTLLGAVLCLVAMVPDLRRYRRKRRALRALRQQLAAGLDPLPPAANHIEQDYQELLAAWESRGRSLQSAADLSRRELLDAFGLWAHQIKTPIAALHLILDTEGGSAELEQELFKVERYVEMALQYLRLGSDATDFVLREYALDDIIRASLRKYAGPFIRKRLTLDYPGTALRVVTDEKWLGFVIEQLIDNALKYTASGTVRLHTEGRDLLISDSGIGVAPEDLPRVFEKGYTGYNGRRDKKSTGLGLYLCKRVLTQLGHTIELSSRPGEGTTVRIGLGTDSELTKG